MFVHYDEVFPRPGDSAETTKPKFGMALERSDICSELSGGVAPADRKRLSVLQERAGKQLSAVLRQACGVRRVGTEYGRVLRKQFVQAGNRKGFEIQSKRAVPNDEQHADANTRVEPVHVDEHTAVLGAPSAVQGTCCRFSVRKSSLTPRY